VKTKLLSLNAFIRFGSISILLIPLIFLANISWKSEEARMTRQNTPPESEEPLLITQPVVQEFANNNLKFRLLADNAQIFEQTQITKLENIYIYLFDVTSTASKTRIKAQSGEIRSESGIMHLWGRVRVDTSDGQVLKTEEMFLNQKQNVIYNHSVVNITTREDEIVASAMHYDLTNGVLTLNKPEAKIEL
jgi:LPS export ABC transporter protein LptC